VKKISLILLLTIYALSSFGIGVKEFYCCGKLETKDLVFLQQDKQKTGKPANTDCCQNKYHFYKVSDTHAAAVDIFSPAKYFTFLPLNIPTFQGIALASQQLNIAANGSHAPPPYSGVSIFILNCNYRI